MKKLLTVITFLTLLVSVISTNEVFAISGCVIGPQFCFTDDDGGGGGDGDTTPDFSHLEDVYEREAPPAENITSKNWGIQTYLSPIDYYNLSEEQSTTNMGDRLYVPDGEPYYTDECSTAYGYNLYLGVELSEPWDDPLASQRYSYSTSYYTDYDQDYSFWIGDMFYKLDPFDGNVHKVYDVYDLCQRYKVYGRSDGTVYATTNEITIWESYYTAENDSSWFYDDLKIYQMYIPGTYLEENALAIAVDALFAPDNDIEDIIEQFANDLFYTTLSLGLPSEVGFTMGIAQAMLDASEDFYGVRNDLIASDSLGTVFQAIVNGGIREDSFIVITYAKNIYNGDIEYYDINIEYGIYYNGYYRLLLSPYLYNNLNIGSLYIDNYPGVSEDKLQGRIFPNNMSVPLGHFYTTSSYNTISSILHEITDKQAIHFSQN